MHFVNRGVVSVGKTMRDGHTVKIGAVGVEGVIRPIAGRRGKLRSEVM